MVPANFTQAADFSRYHAGRRLRVQLYSTFTAALLQVYGLAKRGADWWAAHLFKHKTYVEARSGANPFVAFWRVYAFHAVLLTFMAALVS
jgi:hypothetical protein